ncbi:MAG: glutathione S-transferase N-terminal domain-containing protein, partial [Pseudomonadota bacterium]|nr:glutathione S-transferase N-terminal domain-containing protein [Pseudomonadota bacterium]
MRARMALGVAGIACELREVHLRDKPMEMLALSEKGTVPVLHLSDGRVIDESLDVMHWALAHHDPLDWLDTLDLDGWVALFDDTFKYHLDRYKYASRFDGAEAKTHRTAARDVLAELEPHLEKGWIGGV